MTSSLKVAVIGAGVAGLSAARELQRESHQVVVFEKSHRLGGTWVYDPRVESDPLGIDQNRDIVHGSIYQSLRTNLPRQLMSFTDFKFSDREYGDQRMSPGHSEVLKFLEDFATNFEITQLIRFNTEVTKVEVIDSGSTEFRIESKTSGVNSVEVFDAVVVCNGHHTVPLPATDIPGIETWTRKQLHSHNYRDPGPFRDLSIVVIGNGASAKDISKELAMVAKEVHVSTRSPLGNAKLEKFDNIWQHPKIKCVSKDTVTFEDKFSIEADIIVHCTGYKYHMPFLKTNDIVTTKDKHVAPVYKHVFHPQLSPRLSFVGLPDKIFTFPLVECQSRWVAQALSGKVSLPSTSEMLSDIEAYYQETRIHNHSLGFKTCYIDWMFSQTGIVMEKRIKDMIDYLIHCIMTVGPYGYMDVFLEKYGN